MSKNQPAEDLSEYSSRSARALVLLHETHLRRCLKIWQAAKAANLELPKTDDEHYASLETLLQHIFRSAGKYLVGICGILELPDPGVEPVPEVSIIESKAEGYLEHLLARWRLPLAGVANERLEPPPETYVPGMPYWVDAMLEHAVMYPVRHDFQLSNLLRQQAKR